MVARKSRAGAGGLNLRLNLRLPHSCSTSEPFSTRSPQDNCNASRRELQTELVIRAREEVCCVTVESYQEAAGSDACDCYWWCRVVCAQFGYGCVPEWLRLANNFVECHCCSCYTCTYILHKEPSTYSPPHPHTRHLAATLHRKMCSKLAC